MVNDSKSADDIFPQRRDILKEIDELKERVKNLEIDNYELKDSLRSVTRTANGNYDDE